MVLDRAENQTYEATVDLTGDAVVSFELIPGVTPNFTMDEFHAVDEAMRTQPEVIAALAGRGFTDLSLVLMDVWTYGKAMMPEQHTHRRLGWCDLWARETPEGNPFRASDLRSEAAGGPEHARVARDRGPSRLRAS